MISNPRFRKYRPGDIAVGTGGGGLSPMEGEYVTVVRKVPWRTVEGSYRDPGPRAVYFRRKNGEISWTFPQYLHLVEGSSNPPRQSFEDATSLLGWAIADRLFAEKDPEGRISADDREWFGDWAHDRLAELFAHDPKWNRRLRGPRGRDHGYMWVGHWMDSYMGVGHWMDSFAKDPEAFKRRERDRKRRLEMKGLARSAANPRRGGMRLEDFKKSPIPDVATYRGKEFRMVHYSMEGGYGPNKQRSKEIIWESEDGDQIYLNGDEIELIPAARAWGPPRGKPSAENPLEPSLALWVEAELINDESSSDEEMEDWFVSEGGIPRAVAKELVRLRERTWKEWQGHGILGDIERILEDVRTRGRK